MDERPSVDDLMNRWQALQQEGKSVSAEDLCAACPEQIDELKRRLEAAAESQPGDAATLSQGGVGGRTRQVPGGAVAGYEILGELGRGGMGVVYEARQISLKRLVALKMILAGAHVGAEGRGRFRAEAEAVAHLQHPNIVQVYEIGEHDGCPYFSMELVSGGSLARRLKDEPLSHTDAARLAEILARAVQHAHQRGIVHRDLKPSNVLLTDDGAPKITDFGLAKRLEDGDSARTRTGAILGTPSYMAPEQAEGKTEQLGPLVDVYALGAILYELLAGRPPFRGDSVMTTLQQVAKAEPAPPSRHRPGIDRDLETICLKAMAKDPAQRYPSALALAQDLERHLAGEPILARRAGVVSRLWRRARRSPVKALAVPLLLLASGAAVLVHQAFNRTWREAELTRAFEDGLREKDWRGERGDELERLIGELEPFDPAQAVNARRLLHEHFIDRFRTSLRRPRLDPQDIARLRSDLLWLAARDAGTAQTLGGELQRRTREWQPRFEARAPWDNVDEVFGAGRVQPKGRVLELVKPPPPAGPVLTSIGSEGRVELQATFDAEWENAGRVGLVLSAGPKRAGYIFRLSVAGGEPARADETAPSEAKTFGQSGGSGQMQILRNGIVLRRQPVAVAKGSLTLSVKREADRLHFQINRGEPVVFFDAVPLQSGAADVFGIEWPAGVGLERLWAKAQTQPETGSPLERGDRLFDEGRFSEAEALFREQAIAAPNQESGREARCKAGLCLVQLNRNDDAAALFEPLAAEAEGRWALLAACRLWLIRLEQQRLEETGALSTNLRARFQREELAAYVPEDVKARLLGTGGLRRLELIVPSTQAARRVEEIMHLTDLFGEEHGRWAAHYDYTRALALVGAEAQALEASRATLPLALSTATHGYNADGAPIWTGRWHGWLLRSTGQATESLHSLLRYRADFAEALRRRNPDDAKLQEQYRPLDLDLVRSHAALGAWEEAERLIDAFLKITPDPVANYNHYAAGWLMKGFLCERRNAPEEGRRAWKEGLLTTYVRKLPDNHPNKTTRPFGADGIVLNSILMSLADELTDADAEAFWNELAPTLAGDGFAAQISGLLRPSATILRGMWRTGEGRDCARRFAFLDVAPAKYGRLPLYAGMAEKFRHEALGGKPNSEQDAVVWVATRTAVDRFCEGKVSKTQLLQLALSWKGTTGFLGWAGVAPQLDPTLRGPIAYLLGHRALGRAQLDDARTYFRTALADAPPDTALRRLAKLEMDRLGK